MRALPHISDAELELMQILWKNREEEGYLPLSTAEIMERLGTGWSVSTVFTLLSRLGDKGFVRSEKVGRSARYTPLVSQEDYLAGQSRRFLDQLCGGSLSTFANALCSSGLTRQELDELRDLLNGGKL